MVHCCQLLSLFVLYGEERCARVCVCVCKQDTPFLARDPETQGRWTEMEVQGEVCEPEIRAGRSAECQSCCWNWLPHMALCPGYANRCVTSESAVCVCVCVCVFQTPTHTLCEESDLCNNPPPPSSCYRVNLYPTLFLSPPASIATSIIVMDTSGLLSPGCDITHVASLGDGGASSADRRKG